MPLRYRALVALTLITLAYAPGWAAKPGRHRTAAGPTPEPVLAERLYSRRALRRAKTIVELKLLELRLERLERLRKAIERGIPIEQILDASH
jgi:hypothetical protein